MNESLRASCNAFFAQVQNEPRRILHGRGGLYPGCEHLAIDWYGPTVLISAYDAVADEQLLCDALLQADQQRQIASILLQRRYLKGVPCEALHGTEVETAVVTEAGLRYEVHPGVKQNAGLFLDTAPLRQWLRDHSNGLNVLNLFAYTCSFSIAALAGGASAVTNVDMSKTSIEWGRRNHALNGLDRDKVNYVPHNLFRSWGRIKQSGRYDLVIIDPPTRQRGSFDAEKNYGAVLKKLPGMTHPGAEVIATLNSPFLGSDYLMELFREFLPHCEFLESMPVAPEFADATPEKALKICRFRMPGLQLRVPSGTINQYSGSQQNQAGENHD